MIPEAFAKTTVEREGAAGEAWLAELPGIVEDLLAQWDVQRDGDVLHGQVGVVVPVEGNAVMKVSFPHPGNDYEPDAFEAWDGRGAVKLYERDDTRYAMLLERVHPQTLAAHPAEAAAIAGDVLRQLTIPAPNGLPRMSDKAESWREELLKDAAELDHPLPASIVDAALAAVDELCRVQPETLVHGDFHARNILRADREPWLVVDPKGYVGDPGFDAAVFLGTRAYYLFLDDGLVGAEHFRRLQAELDAFATASGIDAERIRRWSQLIVVQKSFWARRYGFGRARGGTDLDDLVRLTDDLAVALADPRGF